MMPERPGFFHSKFSPGHEKMKHMQHVGSDAEAGANSQLEENH